MPAEDREVMKRQRFVRVGQRRTQRVIKALQVLGNCGNRGAYSYAEKDVEKIFAAITKELERTRLRFADKREVFHLE